MNLNPDSKFLNVDGISPFLSEVSNKIVVVILGLCILLSAIVSTFTYGFEFLALFKKVASKFDLYCPEISIFDGRATIREKQPYFVELPQDKNVMIVIDTREEPKPKPITNFKENSTGILLLRNSLIVKNRDEMSEINLEKFPDMILNSQTLLDALNNYRSSILLVLFIIGLVYYGMSKITQTLICAMAIFLVTRQLSIPFGFGRGFKLAIFIIAPATMVDLALKSLNVLSGSQLYIYLGCYAGTMFWLVKDLISDPSMKRFQ